ncbi:MAG: ammonia-forming cytochrome c nitrite reductase subunit c552 [Planctomycetota bacterium]
MSNKLQWIIWSLATIGLVTFFAISLTSQPNTVARTFLPGVTTHGHYQIELQCSSCHTPGMGVQQDACVKCHGAELKTATDTHPKTKFSDPGKAHLLVQLDARSCTTCHEEHVPDRTQAMGLSLPDDYCWHCHQEIGEQRPSHKDFAYDSCATTGCHNYHDNRALFENFLVAHFGEPDVLDDPSLPRLAYDSSDRTPLNAKQHDAPDEWNSDAELLSEWATTAHAKAGVNCTACHSAEDGTWRQQISHDSCRGCHENQVAGFLAGRHGMRLAADLPPMTPSEARLPMKHSSFHSELTCAACHSDHRFDTRFAAVDGCLQCHDDEHSTAYRNSSHFDLWQAEVEGAADPGTGVSCATCHMPRVEDDDGQLFVQHNQNDNLRPNDKMLRNACGHCHGLQFSLDALADIDLINRNFVGESKVHIESIDMAKAWADERARLREERKRKRQEKK